MISEKRVKRMLDLVVDPLTRAVHVHCDAPSIAVLTLPADPPLRMRVCLAHRRFYNKLAKQRALELVAESFVGGLCEFATLSVQVTVREDR